MLLASKASLQGKKVVQVAPEFSDYIFLQHCRHRQLGFRELIFDFMQDRQRAACAARGRILPM